VGFYVSVAHSNGLEIPKGFEELEHVELYIEKGNQLLLLLEVHLNFVEGLWDEVHYEVQMHAFGCFTLEGMLQADDVGVLQLGKDLQLPNLVLLAHIDRFNGYMFPRLYHLCL